MIILIKNIKTKIVQSSYELTPSINMAATILLMNAINTYQY